MRVLLLVAMLCAAGVSFAQWNPNGATTGPIYYTGGSVGIGTASPGHKLHVVGSNASTNNFAQSANIVSSVTGAEAVFGGVTLNNDPNVGAMFIGARARDNSGSTSPVLLDDVLTGFYGRGYSGSGSGWGGNIAAVRILAAENFSSTSQGTKIDFGTTPLGGTVRTTRMIIDPSGNIGIGTAGPTKRLEVVTSNSLDGVLLRHSNSKWVHFYPSNLTADAFNGITAANDAGIIFGGNAGVNSVDYGFVIAPHRDGQSGLRINSAGLVGIGVESPTARLHVRGGSDAAVMYIRQEKNDGGSSDIFTLRDDRGYNGANTGTTFKIESWKGASVTAGGTLANFVTINDGVQTSRLLIDNTSGNVGIGTTNPTQKLEVNGTVYSREVKVDLAAGTGPDYVFEPTYNLPTLAETEAYIKANKHLPEVPSAKEMEANGINLSEMNMLLLKKVEELTLHLIELNKTNADMQHQLTTQQKEIESLKSKLK